MKNPVTCMRLLLVYTYDSRNTGAIGISVPRSWTNRPEAVPSRGYNGS